VKVRITDLEARDESFVDEIATMLVDGFRQKAPEAYPNLASALAEVRESFAPDRISLVAVNDQGTAVGWIGGINITVGTRGSCIRSSSDLTNYDGGSEEH
jgi:aminoglycoside 6'-N-acetyltransferase I